MPRKYATVDPNIWNQTEWRKLTDDAQRLYFYVTTSPTAEANAYILSAVVLADDLRWDIGRIDRAFKALAVKPFAIYDGAARVVYIADYWTPERNKIPNGNYAHYLARHLFKLPNSPLKARAIADLRATGWWTDRIEEVLSKWRYVPVAEDENAPDERQGDLLPAPQQPAKAKTEKAKREATKLPADWEPTERMLTYAKANGIDGAALDYVTKNFRRYWSGEGKPMKDWEATWKNAVDREVERRAERKPNGANGNGQHAENFGVAPPADVNWAERMRMWLGPKKVWLGAWGPKPGEPHCEVPAQFLSPPPPQ